MSRSRQVLRKHVRNLGAGKRGLDILQRPSARFRHVQQQNDSRRESESSEEEVGPVRGSRQKKGRDERD